MKLGFCTVYSVHNGHQSAPNTMSSSFSLVGASINDTKGERENKSTDIISALSAFREILV